MQGMTKKQEIEYQRSELRRLIPEGSTVYGIVEHVARSGMMAVIRLVVFVDGTDLHPNYGAALVTGSRLVQKNGFQGIRVNGCGFNRVQHVVDSLAHAIYGRANALKYRVL